jgi:glutathione S-transferase
VDSRRADRGAGKIERFGDLASSLAVLDCNDRNSLDSGRVRPQTEDERLEALRWILFDNQKVNGYLGPYRFLRWIAKPPGDPAVLQFLKGRIDNALGIVDQRLGKSPFIVGDHPTIADISLSGYLYYPTDEFGFDIAGERKNIGAWLARIKKLPGWAHPYDLMPGHPLPGR